MNQVRRETDYYPSDYFAARRRFVDFCQRAGFQHDSRPIHAPSPSSELLTIDIALRGATRPRTAVIVSSGLHGVEGFFGSAVQLACLDRLAPDWQPPSEAAIILLHALNPFGYAWRRRFNEDNVDLNRNFLLSDQSYIGAPPLSGAFRSVLAPARPPRRFNTSTARMAYLALRHGVKSFWETLPVGQYDYPDWLYFGGTAPTQTALALEELLPPLLEHAEEAIHLDFHTGLGRWADCKLLLSETETPAGIQWWKQHFGTQMVSEPSVSNKYEIRGGFGPWLQHHFLSCRYHFATAEFGTYSPIRVIRALSEELRWHAQIGAQSPDHWSRRRLVEAFVPRNRKWRQKSLETGLSLLQRATEICWRSQELARQ